MIAYDSFLTFEALSIVVPGLIAFMMSTCGGLLLMFLHFPWRFAPSSISATNKEFFCRLYF